MYNPFSLAGKTILITGASSGIGKETAIVCSKLGANVVITGRNKDRLTDTYKSLDTESGQSHLCLVADLSSEEGVIELVSNMPKLDGVVSNAGFVIPSLIKFIKAEDMQKLMDTNTFSHVLLAKMLYKKKLLNNNGSYVFTASIGGNFNYSLSNAMYGMTKSALNSFMKYCAVEFATKGIRCNSICPGMIETPMNSNDGSFTKEDFELDTQKYLLKRYGKPHEIAEPIAFLMSDASSFMTGHTMVVDGGVTINK